tara:strand:- start:1398 stop:1940 length:543 start_codon:yes stop_codon:yes gene_type:complete
MVDPITIAAGFALAKKSIEVCKSALETAEDVQGIAGHLDNLFEQKDKVEQHVADAKNKPQSAMQKAIAEKTDGDNSDTSLSAITAEVLERKKLDRAILNLSIAINSKFGEGTFDQILQLREERLKEKKAQEEKAKAYLAKKRKKDKIFWDSVWKAIWQLAIVLSVVGIIAWIILKNCKSC